LSKLLQFVANLFLLSAIGLAQTTGKVNVTAPVSGSTVASPVHFVASAQAPANRHITAMRIYVDYQSVYTVSSSSLNTYVTMTQGSHKATVQAWDSSGSVYKKWLSLTVTAPTPTPTPSPTPTPTPSPTPSPSPTPTISVAISPASATVQTGQSQQFTATVTGTTNTAVQWQVDGLSGGTSTVGYISSTGLYTAPASVPSGGSVNVTAVSAANSASSATAKVSIAPPSTGPALYVSMTGSDSNPCTSSAPCRTINRADSLATPGTTVHVAAGNYTGPFRATHSGTASAHLVFVSDQKWGAKISATGLGSGATFRSDGSYVEIRGFDVSGDGPDGILNNGSFVLLVGNRVHNVTDTGCYGGGGLHSWGNHAISNVQFIGNLVHDIGNPDSSSPCNQVHAIYEENPHGLIVDNIVYRASGYGIHLWHGASDALVANNTSFNNRESGIVIGGGDSGVTTGNNNTACFNNIAYNNSKYGITQQGVFGPNNVFVNNLIYGNAWGAVSGLSETRTVTADPLFVNYNPTGTGDYHLQSGSPAMGAGVGAAPAGTNPGLTLGYDFDGNSRPVSGRYDVGAYEHQ